MAVNDQTPTATDATNSARDTTLTATDRSLAEKMPDSVRDFGEAMGRRFECPECGAPTTGTCSECNTTHPALREDSR